jgi:adenylate cyclase
VISHLGRIDRLRVKSRDAVRRVRSDTSTVPAALGRTLGVRFLVEGSVRRVGERVRVTVRLVNSADGFRVWGADFNRGTADVLAVEAEIAESVAVNVAGQLLPGERALLTRRPTRDLEAYDHYLRGNHYLAQRTGRSAALAIKEYGAATTLDSGFTRALALGAYAHALILSWGWEYAGVSAAELLDRGLAIAERALSQDSASSEAWMARAYLLTSRNPRTFQGVRAAFERAIALDPQNAEANHQYGWVLGLLGEDSAAVSANLRTLSIDPERAVTLAQLGELSMAGRHFAEAGRWLDSALVVDPGADYARSDRAFVRLWLGETAGARADAVRLNAPALLAMLDLRSGDTALARSRIGQVLRGLRRSDSVTVPTAWDPSMALVTVGESDRAIDLLERVRPRGPVFWFLLRMPVFDPVRSDPRFGRLVEQSRPVQDPEPP